jgi:O-antigen/teichoic acid export membrane protein
MKFANFIWISLSLGLPGVAAALSVPLLLDTLGDERFGLIALAWGLIGYSAAFDMGIGKASTQLIADLKSRPSLEAQKIKEIIHTAVIITLVTSSLGAAIFIIAGTFGVGNLIKISGVERSEIFLSIVILSLGLPFQAIGATYRGVSEAYFRFRGISIVRAVAGISIFVFPLIVIYFDTRIHYLIASIVISRVIALLLYRILAFKCIEEEIGDLETSFSRVVAVKLFKFGGWFTISIFLVPLVGIVDRFIISALISASAVALYVIPGELIAQSLIMVSAVTTLVFPHFVKLKILNPKMRRRYFLNTLAIVSSVMFLVAVFLNVFGVDILQIWLQDKYREEMSKVLEVLSYGLVPYAIGAICTSLLQSNGRTDIAAKINLAEFPFFLLIVYLLIYHYGLQGASYAWVLRVTVDALLFFYFAVNEK